MPTFRFELQAVITQRAAIERTRQLAVAEMERERLWIEDEIRGYQSRIEQERLEMRECLGLGQSAGTGRSGGTVNLRAARLQATAGLHLMARAHQSVLRLAGVMQRLAGARGELLRATTAKKAVEALRERRFAAWRDEQNRIEERAMDELAIMRAARAPALEYAP